MRHRQSDCTGRTRSGLEVVDGEWSKKSEAEYD